MTFPCEEKFTSSLFFASKDVMGTWDIEHSCTPEIVKPWPVFFSETWDF